MHTWQKSHLQHLTWKFESTSFYIGLWLTIKDEFTKNFPNLCWNKIVINFCKEMVCCGGEREVIKYLTSNIAIHLFPVYKIKRRWMKLDRGFMTMIFIKQFLHHPLKIQYFCSRHLVLVIIRQIALWNWIWLIEVLQMTFIKYYFVYI